jgi:adenosylmethionine-8-amino-7-oxononanoate aminotransferase
MERELREALEPLSGATGVEGWWARGLLAGVALHPGRAGGRSAREFARSAWERGLLVYPVSGPAGQGDVVLLAPPLTVTSTEIAQIGERLLAACD